MYAIHQVLGVLSRTRIHVTHLAPQKLRRVAPNSLRPTTTTFHTPQDASPGYQRSAGKYIQFFILQCSLTIIRGPQKQKTISPAQSTATVQALLRASLGAITYLRYDICYQYQTKWHTHGIVLLLTEICFHKITSAKVSFFYRKAPNRPSMTVYL